MVKTWLKHTELLKTGARRAGEIYKIIAEILILPSLPDVIGCLPQ
jgi:hypothetical protein